MIGECFTVHVPCFRSLNREVAGMIEGMKSIQVDLVLEQEKNLELKSTVQQVQANLFYTENELDRTMEQARLTNTYRDQVKNTLYFR